MAKAEGEAEVVVRATGGGSIKFLQSFADVGVQLDFREEMLCIVTGLTFLIKYAPGEVFTIESSLRSPIASPAEATNDFKKAFRPKSSKPYPFLLVNIGSGVSIIKVDGEGELKRISGSSLGGSTFWGLCSLLTDCMNFGDMIDMTKHGNISNIDM